MKIGFYFKDKGLYGVDMSRPDKGNPGIGGTQFCFLIAAYYLLKSDKNIEIVFYHYNENKLPEGVGSVIIHSEKELLKRAEDDLTNLLVVQNGWNPGWYELLRTYPGKCVCWCHNYLEPLEANVIADCVSIKRVIFVGREQYDFYLDHRISKKAQYIYNMFQANQECYGRKEGYKNIVTYTGSLVYGKGFHVLAGIWKQVLEYVPDAELYILGSGKLYSRDAKLGKFQLAEDNYERQFISCLLDKDGNLLPSVHFIGVVGEGKEKIYNQTAVGVVNPTGHTETFCLSAVEMEACGVPIVTKKVHGLLDTVKNRETGLLFHTNKQFARYIVRLLKKHEVNNQYGAQAREFVKREFCPEKLAMQWIAVFEDVISDREVLRISGYRNLTNDSKWVKLLHLYFIRIFHLNKSTAVFEKEYFGKLFLKKLMRKR